MNQETESCPSCKAHIAADNILRKCSLCGWDACRKCAPDKFCPDCKRATMENVE